MANQLWPRRRASKTNPADTAEQLSRIEANQERILALLSSQRDRIPELRERLKQVRASEEYAKVWDEADPLITVRIATYNRPKELVEVAIASVLRQTYQNFEIIVVGDGAAPEIGKRLAELKDKRISYVNFPFRRPYPEDPKLRYLVAGAPGMNLGANLAKGSWIAPLDDDDEFAPDHLETLLHFARDTHSELAYGKLHMLHPETKEFHAESGVYPPVYGGFSFQSALYLRLLNFIEYDEQSWLVNEPGDWNLCRRMMAAGVTMRMTDQVVGNLYPASLKTENSRG